MHCLGREARPSLTTEVRPRGSNMSYSAVAPLGEERLRMQGEGAI